MDLNSRHTLLILIGRPGSGKTTVATEFASLARFPAKIYNERLYLFGVAARSSTSRLARTAGNDIHVINRIAYRLAFRGLLADLAADFSKSTASIAVVEFARSSYAQDIRSLCSSVFPTKWCCAFLDVPFIECLRRNAARALKPDGYRVPESEMYSDFLNDDWLEVQSLWPANCVTIANSAPRRARDSAAVIANFLEHVP